MKDGSGPSGPSRDNAATTLTPTCANPPTPPSSATAGSAAPSNGTTSQRQIAFMRERYPEAEIVSGHRGRTQLPKRKGLVSLLERLHRGDKLRIVVAHQRPARPVRIRTHPVACRAERRRYRGSRQQGLQPRAGTHPGYSRHPPYLLLPTSRPAALPQRNQGGSGSIRQGSSRRILRLWFDAARWCYNETVAKLKADPELKANWKAHQGRHHPQRCPDRLKAAPYQVKSIAVRDACRAMSEVKRRNGELGPGLPAGEYHELGFRSRKALQTGLLHTQKRRVTEFRECLLHACWASCT